MASAVNGAGVTRAAASMLAMAHTAAPATTTVIAVAAAIVAGRPAAWSPLPLFQWSAGCVGAFHASHSQRAKPIASRAKVKRNRFLSIGPGASPTGVKLHTRATTTETTRLVGMLKESR